MTGKDQSVLGTIEHITNHFHRQERTSVKSPSGYIFSLFYNGYFIHNMNFVCVLIISTHLLSKQVIERDTYSCLLMNELLIFIFFCAKE